MSPHLDPHRLVEVSMKPGPMPADLTGPLEAAETYWRCRCGVDGVAIGDDAVRRDHGAHAAEATLDALYRCAACGERTTPETLDALDGVCHDCLLLDARAP
ncbi:MAG: hypothetical protein F4Y94_04145 [Chloroflexi bacterium]|nr:hypothetical protein [Chloroflexota bacterium]